ncbi:killer cell lectin-like receptor subfamily F member 1 isoform X2 [Strix uralensis]|uniref:killer cell lectin-like receptor subfamily F member 1 isoform X2 n=1 Tax=Strix uralensis TaxID=36305 RepID=UPI003DA746C8
MAATTIYARCDFATSKPDSPPRSAPSTRRKLPRPWWYWMLLGSGWVGTVLLVGVVLRLLQQHGGNNPIPSQDAEVLGSGCSWESCWTNSSQRATPEFKCSLSCFRLQLRQRLCEEQHQHPTGPSACWLCPTGWQLFGAKCYWISTKTESWEKAAKDCLDQRSQLVKLESAEEKVFIGNMTKNISAAWLGLSITRARGKEWTWWDGSLLQGTLFLMPDHGEGGICATIQRGELNHHSCTIPLHWICQKEATEV